MKVEQFLSNWQNVFSQSPTDLGCTNADIRGRCKLAIGGRRTPI